MSNSFWEGGPSAYRKALREEYNAKLAELRDRLKNCELFREQSELEQAINELKAEYKRRRSGVDRMQY